VSVRAEADVWAQRLRVYPAAVLAAFVGVFALHLWRADGVATETARLGGDFPAFYAAGSLVADGRVDEVYDGKAQAEAPVGISPDAPDAFFMFAYPLFVAVVFAPLAQLDFLTAYTVHTMAMAGFLWLAVSWVVPLLPRIAHARFAFFVALLAFYPMLRAVSGQNTALSALLVAGIWRGLASGRHAGAGLALGMLFYKPQLALPIAGLIALGGSPRILLWATPSLALLYGLGTAAGGWTWPAAWWQAAARFQVQDQALNASHSVGILGVLEAVLGVGSPVALVAGGLATAALSLYLAHIWFRSAHSLNVRMGLACCGLALIPPHSMYYEAGLAGFGLAVLANEGGRPAWVLAGLYGLAYLEPLSSALGVNPLAGLVCAIAVLLARTPTSTPA
jgi:hypothetical protein